MEYINTPTALLLASLHPPFSSKTLAPFQGHQQRLSHCAWEWCVQWLRIRPEAFPKKAQVSEKKKTPWRRDGNCRYNLGFHGTPWNKWDFGVKQVLLDFHENLKQKWIWGKHILFFCEWTPGQNWFLGDFCIITAAWMKQIMIHIHANGYLFGISTQENTPWRNMTLSLNQQKKALSDKAANVVITTRILYGYCWWLKACIIYGCIRFCQTWTNHDYSAS